MHLSLLHPVPATQPDHSLLALDGAFLPLPLAFLEGVASKLVSSPSAMGQLWIIFSAA